MVPGRTMVPYAGAFARFGAPPRRAGATIRHLADDQRQAAGRDAHLEGGVIAALSENADLLADVPQIEKVDVLAEKVTSGEVTKGLLLQLPIKESHRDDAAEFLRRGESVVEKEPDTTNWFAIRFENGDHGVFDVFPNPKGRRAHLTGKIPQQLAVHGLPWLDGLPHMSFADVLAEKVSTA